MELKEAMEWLSNKAHALSFFSDADSRDASEAIRTVIAALKWRPIAEAPKDGTEVELFVPDDVLPGYVYIASYSEWSGWTDTHGATVEGQTHYRLIGPLPVVKP